MWLCLELYQRGGAPQVRVALVPAQVLARHVGLGMHQLQLAHVASWVRREAEVDEHVTEVRRSPQSVLDAQQHNLALRRRHQRRCSW